MKFWSQEEDKKLCDAMNAMDHNRSISWKKISKHLNGRRTPKQCRERWCNHLHPHLRPKKPWTLEEEILLNHMVHKHGTKWAFIKSSGGTIFQCRSQNALKNHYYITKKQEKQKKQKKQICAVRGHLEQKNKLIMKTNFTLLLQASKLIDNHHDYTINA